MINCNYAAGLRVHCADRKKAFRSQTRFSRPKRFGTEFCLYFEGTV
ncbi:hypothetical protein [Blautia producta]